jgi:hypothetical protein
MLLLVLGCGRPEDQLELVGRVTGQLDSDSNGVAVTFYRDLGATETGCTTFSPWRQLEASDGGLVRIEYLREETTGRFGINRCLRLAWEGNNRTASLSWLARDRDTQLPDLLTWWDVPGFPTVPSFPLDTGLALPQVQSFEAADERGVIFRQAATGENELELAGAGFEPARDAGLTTRYLQRGQQEEPDAIATQPLLAFEYRVQWTTPKFSGNHAWQEVGRGAGCNVPQVGGTACALTDGLFTPVLLSEGVGALVELTLPHTPHVSTVVLRGMGTSTLFSTIVVETHPTADGPWAVAARQPIDSQAEQLATASLEDERATLYEVVPIASTPGPTFGVRVHLEDFTGKTVPIGWLSEVSLYGGP